MIKGISYLIHIQKFTAYLAVALLLLVCDNLFAQNSAIIEVSQSGVCNGNLTQIQAITNGTFLGWTATNGANNTISTPSGLVSDVQPKVNTTYKATSKFIGDNLIPNGDFELGNQGFESEYKLKDSTKLKNGEYIITNSPYGLSTAYIKKSDHTSGSGNLLLADGAITTKSVYKVTIPVIEGTEYIFNAWFANTHKELANANPDTSISPPIQMSFLIDGIEIGNYQTLPDTLWNLFSRPWKATASKTITIEIKDLTTTLKGNDFVLDDISFKPIVYKSASIQVLPCNHSTVFSPDGDGNFDTYYIEEEGSVKIFDMDGALVRELQAPGHWDGLKNNGSPVGIGYYAIVVNGKKVIRISLVR